MVFRLLLLWALIITSYSSQAKEPVIWVTESWQNFTETDGSGLYHEIMVAVFETTDYELEVEYAPWKRSLFKVENLDADITGAMPKNGRFYFSTQPILKQPRSILFDKSKLTISSLSQLSKYVGTWPKEYEKELFTDEIRAHISGFSTADRTGALKVLMYGRSDYYFDTRAILDLSLIELNQKMPAQNFQIKDIGYFELHMAFSKSAKGKKIKELFDKRIEILLVEGRLLKIYDKYHIPFPY
ncbi:MAG: transporter substrate-binding domain-containing protein [Colwellia sp.]|nr:transporter substrate-binding domain-containing protein [Colwellia sp.]